VTGWMIFTVVPGIYLLQKHTINFVKTAKMSGDISANIDISAHDGVI
jgi:hypothetical protein